MSRGSYWRLRVARVEWFTKYCSHKGLRRKHMFSTVFFVTFCGHLIPLAVLPSHEEFMADVLATKDHKDRKDKFPITARIF